MKHQTPTLPKFKKLKRRLGIAKDREAMGLLESLWLLAQKSSPCGDIGREMDNEEIAIELEWDGDANELIDALVETRWLDRCDVYRLVIHDWPAHAPRYIHGIAARKGGFAIPSTVKEHSDGLQSQTKASTVTDSTEEQPNLTKHNLTKPNETKGGVGETVVDASGSGESVSPIGESPTDSQNESKPKKPRNPKPSGVGVWKIPSRFKAARLPDLLDSFAAMRRNMRKPIVDFDFASKHLDLFDDDEHLVFAIEHCLANGYQGLKAEYRPRTRYPTNGTANGSQSPRKMLTEIER